MEHSLAGKIALVTGASSGIGRAIASALAAAGCDLCLVGRNPDRLNAVAEKFRELRRTVLAVRADLVVAADVAHLAQTVAAEFKQLDFLIHSAGTISWGPIENGSPDNFDAQYQLNTSAPHRLTRFLLPLLRRARGQVVFINSLAGLVGRPNVAAYSASKYALKGFADSLREEVVADGVRVLSLFLGKTDTPMQRELFRVQDLPYQGDDLLQPADVARVLLSLVSLPPRAEVTELTLRPTSLRLSAEPAV